MPLLRVNFFFIDRIKRGWSETYFVNVATRALALGAARNLAPLRVNLLGQQDIMTEIRVSDDEIKRDSAVYYVPVGDGASIWSEFGESDIANTALNVRLDAGGINRRTLYMRGIPDKMTVSSGLWIPTARWLTKYKEFEDELVNGTIWGLKAITAPVGRIGISGAVQDAVTGRVTYTTVVAHGFTAGRLININGYRGAAWQNGRNVVVSVPSLSTFVVEGKGFLRPTVGFPTCYLLAYNFVAFTSTQQVGLTHRITGRPFDQPRGRR